MNVLRVAVLLFAFATAVSRAADTNALPTTITIDGVTYEDVRWGTVKPTTVTVFHKSGIANIPLGKLPADLQKRFGYDPQKAATYRAKESAADAQARIAAAERERRYREKRDAENLYTEQQKAESERKTQEQKEVEREAKEERKNKAPVMKINYSDVYNIRPRADGTYSANIITEGDTTQLVFFEKGGLTYFRNHSRGVVYGRVVEAPVSNQYGVQVAETALQVLGSTSFTDVSRNVTYGW